MDNQGKGFSEVVGFIKSLIGQRSEPIQLSRDFWMPDNSCRVCYECDAQFTILNRRHHCRLCGRVFCAKCTANSVPISTGCSKGSCEEGERIRVCNFCHRQWEQETAIAAAAAAAENEFRGSSPGLSRTGSATSITSTKSSCTNNSSSTIGCSVSYATRPYQRLPSSYNSTDHSPCQPSSNEPDNQETQTTRRIMDAIPDTEDSCLNQFGFCMDRSNDDDGYGVCNSDIKVSHHHNSSDYFGDGNYDEVEDVCQVDELHSRQENVDPEGFNTCHGSPEFQGSEGIDEMVEMGPQNAYECDNSSPGYDIEEADAELVDFENNAVLWLPPEPENSDDEKEPDIFYEEGDTASGEFAYASSSKSFGSNESRTRNQPIEENNMAMKDVISGHFRALVSQLLQVVNLDGGDVDRELWLEIITSLSWKVASLLKPDTSKGGIMDPAEYVKVKCLACGRRSDSVVLKGIVCRKNLAHRRMKSRIEKPNVLILGGALEYQRVSHHLSSFDTLLQQEMDHLKMAVAKIAAHQPNVLLVEKTVSRFAQEYILAKGISLVLNVKRPLLERISRCTGAQIVPSIDHLSPQKLGQCDLFYVKKFTEDHNSAGQNKKGLLKNLMFFEGCPRPLGCTVLLMGANSDELKKVKHVMQYGVFAAYHLALETSFLADEGASLPEFPLRSPITVALPDKPSKLGSSVSTIADYTAPAFEDPEPPLTDRESSTKNLAPDPNNLTYNIQRMTLSDCSYSTHDSQNRGQFSTDDFSSSDVHKGPDGSSVVTVNSTPFQPSALFSSSHCFLEDNGGASIVAAQSKNEYVQTIAFPSCDNCAVPTSQDDSPETTSRGNIEATLESSGNQDIEHQNASTSVMLHAENSQVQEYGTVRGDFPPSPSDHQSILVSLSTRCIWKGTVCERSHLFRIKYYGSFDKPLGRFLRDHLFDQYYQCRSCEMPSEAHVHCYTHRQGSLTISVKKLLEIPLAGEQDGKIWMWHRCLRCPRKDGIPPGTSRVVMSDAAWGLSFGKFLELSFSNHAAASRVASCGHSLHRDCLRFYGFGQMVACFRYATINVHSVYLPPAQLDFHTQTQDWVQNEVNEVIDRADLLFTEILNAISRISESNVTTRSVNGKFGDPESRNCIADLESMLHEEKAEFEECLEKVLKEDVKDGEPFVDIFEINKLRRKLLFFSYVWDQRLIYVATGVDSASVSSIEKPSSSEKLVELNTPPNPHQVFLRLDCLALDKTTNEHLKPEPHNSTHLESHPPPNSRFEDGNQESHFFDSSPEQLDISSGIVRRTLSEGQIPLISDLSDTLEAKWTGENATPPAEFPKSKASTTMEITFPLMDLDGHSENNVRPDHDCNSTMVCTVKGSDGPAKDSSRWMDVSFLNFYHSIHKNYVAHASFFHTLYDYVPIYISKMKELDRRGGVRLMLPPGVGNIDSPIYDDEPTSIISHALLSADYHSQMSDERDKIRESGESSTSLSHYDSFLPFSSFDETSSESFRSIGSVDDSMLSISGSRSSPAMDPVLSTKASHVRVSFSDEDGHGKVKYTVTCYYAKRFEALRQACCPEIDYVRSLSRCKKWGAQGGKSNVFFAKTLDDRFIVKQVTKTELESFIKFAPDYFKYLSESICTRSPTCLAKILGIYQVVIKHAKGGKETKMDVLVMENLLYGRSITRLYDLKGSSRSRYNADSTGTNKVLLDENLLEAMPTSPIFVGNKAKRSLERAVWNDTAFLASIDVMDYSLLVGIDEGRRELVLGIIDFMRQYTWDKHLETWVKASGILGGPKNASPTVVSPKQYKKRFRKAMSAYFLMVPDQWSPSVIPSTSQSDFREDNVQQLSQET